MPIRVKCACGKGLSVKDELAGKRIKCPGCGEALPVPRPKDAPAKKPAPVKKRVADDDDDDDGTPYDVTAKDKGPTPEEIEEAEVKRLKRVAKMEEQKEEKESSDKLKHFIVCGVGVVLLIVLGVAPFLNWFSLKNTGGGAMPADLYTPKTTLLGGEWDKEGKIFIGVTFFCALLAGVGLALYGALGEDAGEHALTINSCIAEFWGVATLIWTLAFTWWWIFIKRYQFEEKMKTNLSVNISATPDIGMILAIVAALLVCVLFSYSITKRGDTGWCYLSQFLGLALGALLVVLDVKPW